MHFCCLLFVFIHNYLFYRLLCLQIKVQVGLYESSIHFITINIFKFIGYYDKPCDLKELSLVDFNNFISERIFNKYRLYAVFDAIVFRVCNDCRKIEVASSWLIRIAFTCPARMLAVSSDTPLTAPVNESSGSSIFKSLKMSEYIPNASLKLLAAA